MDLNTLLHSSGIDTDVSKVLVLRHSPTERKLFAAMPWLIVEKPDSFNAYQQTQGQKVEDQMEKCDYVASFFAHENDKAAFVGLYQNRKDGLRWVSSRELNQMPAHSELLKYVVNYSGPKRKLFDLIEVPKFSRWKGKLIIQWSPPAISWHRWDAPEKFPIEAILDESVFERLLGDWRSLVLTWEQLTTMSSRLTNMLKDWQGIYYIFDEKDRRGYVGAAYGNQGFYGRWINYRDSGHGGNKLLKLREPDGFLFSILEWMPHGVDKAEALAKEKLWKIRLHTRSPNGLNDN